MATERHYSGKRGQIGGHFGWPSDAISEFLAIAPDLCNADRMTLADEFESLLCAGGVALVVRPSLTRGPVELPDYLLGDAPIVLEYCLAHARPPVELEVTERGVSAVLSFSRTPTPTFVPWECVLAMAPLVAVQLEAKRQRHMRAV